MGSYSKNYLFTIPNNGAIFERVRPMTDDELFVDAMGSLIMYVHDHAPEECHCQQCRYMRDDIARIRSIHGRP